MLVDTDILIELMKLCEYSKSRSYLNACFGVPGQPQHTLSLRNRRGEDFISLIIPFSVFSQIYLFDPDVLMA